MTTYNLLIDLLTFTSIVSGILVITSRNPVISVLFLISVFVNVSGYLLLLGVNFIGITYLIIYVGAIAILFLFVVMMLNIKLVELTDTGQEYTKNLPLGAIVGSLFFFELYLFATAGFTNTVYPLAINTPNLKDINIVNIFTEIFNKFNLLLARQPLPGSSLNQRAASPIVRGANEISFSTTAAMEEAKGDATFYLSGAENKNLFNDPLLNLPIEFKSTNWDNSFLNFEQIESIGQNIYITYTIWFIIGSVILLLAMIGPIILCLKSAATTNTVLPIASFHSESVK